MQAQRQDPPGHRRLTSRKQQPHYCWRLRRAKLPHRPLRPPSRHPLQTLPRPTAAPQPHPLPRAPYGQGASPTAVASPEQPSTRAQGPARCRRASGVCGEEPRGGRVSVHIPALSQVPGTCSHHKPQGGGCPTWRGADSRGCATWWGVDGRGCAKRQWSACRWGGHRPPGKQPTIPTRHGVSLLGEHPQHHAGQAMCCPSTFPASAPHYMVGTHLQP